MATQAASCRVVGVSFIPLAVESLGSWSDLAAKTISRIGRLLGQRLGTVPEVLRVSVERSYSIKYKQKSQYANCNRLTLCRSACSVCLEGTRSHNEGRVSTSACCLLLHLSRAKTLRELLAGDHQ